MVQNVLKKVYVQIIRQDFHVVIITLIMNGKDFVFGIKNNVEMHKLVMNYHLA